LSVPEINDVSALLETLDAYRTARAEFLEALGCGGSNRDPFAEFAESIAVAALGGTMAKSRTQKGWDFMDPEGRRVQVRYLANPVGQWVNEHLVDFRGDGCDRYALLVVEAFEPQALLTFDAAHLGAIGAALGKRHGDQEHTLQLTQRNCKALVADQARFASLGVRVFDLRNAVRSSAKRDR
jgi:hypothetical protein